MDLFVYGSMLEWPELKKYLDGLVSDKGTIEGFRIVEDKKGPVLTPDTSTANGFVFYKLNPNGLDILMGKRGYYREEYDVLIGKERREVQAYITEPFDEDVYDDENVT